MKFLILVALFYLSDVTGFPFDSTKTKVKRYVAIAQVDEAVSDEGKAQQDLKIVAVGVCVVTIKNENKLEEDGEVFYSAEGSIEVTSRFIGTVQDATEVAKTMRKNFEYNVYFALDTDLGKRPCLDKFEDTWLLASSVVAGDSTTVEFKRIMKPDEKFAVNVQVSPPTQSRPDLGVVAPVKAPLRGKLRRLVHFGSKVDLTQV